MTRDRELGAGLESGVYSKTPIKNPEKQLSKPLNDETCKQGPRTIKAPAGGKFK